MQTLVHPDPHPFTAPAQRPPGMAKDVPYEPRAGRAANAGSWLAQKFIGAWYATPVATWPTRLEDWLRRGQLPPVIGTPGGNLADPERSYKVAVVGDMGEGSPSEARNAAQILAWGPTHVATVGDNVYPFGREVDYARRFDPQFQALRMATTWKPALGNHDYYGADLRPYFNRFTETGNHAYYAWSLGPADFFVLDTEQRLDAGSAQLRWLEGELSHSTAPYRVVQMHRPIVSTTQGLPGGIGGGAELAKLFATYGVQLVLAGHEHGYERSKPLDGTVYMVTGGGGAASFKYPAHMPPQSLVRTKRHHHLELAYDAAQMVVRAVDDFGNAFDAFTVNAHGVWRAGATAGAAGVHSAFTPSPAR